MMPLPSRELRRRVVLHGCLLLCVCLDSVVRRCLITHVMSLPRRQASVRKTLESELAKLSGAQISDASLYVVRH